MIVVREEQGIKKNAGDSIIEQKAVLLKDTIGHDWD